MPQNTESRIVPKTLFVTLEGRPFSDRTAVKLKGESSFPDRLVEKTRPLFFLTTADKFPIFSKDLIYLHNGQSFEAAVPSYKATDFPFFSHSPLGKFREIHLHFTYACYQEGIFDSYQRAYHAQPYPSSR